MNVVKKILVPVDFSEHSAKALEFAVDLALKYGTSLTILHVNDLAINLAPYGPLPPSLIDNAAQEAQALLDQTKNQVMALGVRQVDSSLLDGMAFHEIVLFAEQGNYDLIVMGTHGRSGFNRFMLGSVAERVVRRARRPVLTVALRGDALAAAEA